MIFFIIYEKLQVITAFGIGKVVRSKDTNFSEGELVMSRICPVAEFGVLPSNLLQKINHAHGVALPDYLSCLGRLIFKVLRFSTYKLQILTLISYTLLHRNARHNSVGGHREDWKC